jgi:hypothetical protein
MRRRFGRIKIRHSSPARLWISHCTTIEPGTVQGHLELTASSHAYSLGRKRGGPWSGGLIRSDRGLSISAADFCSMSAYSYLLAQSRDLGVRMNVRFRGRTDIPWTRVQSGHAELHCTCPLSGVKRTSLPHRKMTFGSRRCLLVILRERRVLEWAVVESGDARLIRIS